MHRNGMIGVQILDEPVPREAQLGRSPRQKVLPGHHRRVGAARELAGQHLIPLRIARVPGGVQSVQSPIADIKPATKAIHSVWAMTHLPIRVDVPAQFIPGIPPDQVRRRTIPRDDFLDKACHPIPHTGMIRAAAGRDAKVSLFPVG